MTIWRKNTGEPPLFNEELVDVLFASGELSEKEDPNHLDWDLETSSIVEWRYSPEPDKSPWVAFSGELPDIDGAERIDIRLRSGRIYKNYPASTVSLLDEPIADWRRAETFGSFCPFGPGWERNFGAMPVPRDTLVRVLFKNGTLSNAEGSPAFFWNWDLYGGSHQIVQWRRINDGIERAKLDYAPHELDAFAEAAPDGSVPASGVYERAALLVLRRPWAFTSQEECFRLAQAILALENKQ